MPILFHAMIAPLLLCAIHAAPLGQENAFIHTTKMRETGLFSPRFVHSPRELWGPSSVDDPTALKDTWPVCKSVSTWVGGKRTAVDQDGRNVTVLPTVQTRSGVLEQYFYETKCDPAADTSSGCLGVDPRHWTSRCKTQQTLVRALTQDSEERVDWRWIHIDTSCVCTLFNRTGQM